MTPTALTVVVPVRNDAANLGHCLHALNQSSVQPVEVIVVDDASSDETAAVAQQYGARRIALSECGGPAAARNRGVAEATTELVLFLDADVCVAADTLQRIQAHFTESPELDAVFGSYDARPAAPNLLSQYRNLLHHFTHQHARRQASTFWAGCGAVKRSVFRSHGGFDVRYARPSIEDIEFGVRLSQAGRKILLDPRVQVKHRKRWGFWSMIKADVMDRAIPWTRLIFRERQLPNDLNLKSSQRFSVVMALLFFLLLAVGIWQRPEIAFVPVLYGLTLLLIDSWSMRQPLPMLTLASAAATVFLLAVALYYQPLAVWPPVLCVAVIVWLNLSFYRFLFRHRGPAFATFVLPVHISFFVYSGGAFVIGGCSYALDSLPRLLSSPRSH